MPWGVFVTNALFSVAIAWALLRTVNRVLTSQATDAREDRKETRDTIERNTAALTKLEVSSAVQNESLKNVVLFMSRAQLESVRHSAATEGAAAAAGVALAEPKVLIG